MLEMILPLKMWNGILLGNNDDIRLKDILIPFYGYPVYFMIIEEWFDANM